MSPHAARLQVNARCLRRTAKGPSRRTDNGGHGSVPSVLTINVWSAPPLQGNIPKRWKPFASMYPAYWWSPRPLALMEYARTGPHNAGGHERPVYRSG